MIGQKKNWPELQLDFMDLSESYTLVTHENSSFLVP